MKKKIISESKDIEGKVNVKLFHQRSPSHTSRFQSAMVAMPLRDIWSRKSKWNFYVYALNGTTMGNLASLNMLGL